MIPSRELAFLRVVAERSGMLGWHGVETRLAGQEPYKPSAPELARRLDRIGLIETVPGGTHGFYAITERGREVLHEIDDGGWLLGPWEACVLAGQLGGAIGDRLAALAPFFETPDVFEVVARQLGASGLSIEHLAWAAQIVMQDNRSVVAFPYATDPDPAIRLRLFLAWGGPGEGADPESRFRAPGPAYDWNRDPMFVDLLHTGLADANPSVRDAAARLVYLTMSGLHVIPDLLADLASSTPSRWSAAALGTATDSETLAILRSLVAPTEEPDDRASDELAGGAIRALAARVDGRADLIAALHDRRRHVAWSAECSLGYIVAALTADELAAIERDATDGTRTALAYYHSRHRPQ